MRIPDSALQWLLEPDDPSVRYFTLTDLLDEPVDSPIAAKARAAIARGPRVRVLLSGQRVDGGFGVHPYQKWTGAHWRLVSLVELGIPARSRKAVAAAKTVLDWLCGETHRRAIKKIDGRVRRCGSQEGNALAVCCRLGMEDNPRVKYLAESLMTWQWPDGGWNCDRHREAHHSSFYESLSPLWGLIEYYRTTKNRESLKTIDRTVDMFLRHRLFRSERTGEAINPEWLQLHYPLYWRYDILQALTIISRLGKLTDPRLNEALDIIEAKRPPDGRWRPEGYYWKRPGCKGSHVEVVDWGRRQPCKMITLNALRVLKAAGRWKAVTPTLL